MKDNLSIQEIMQTLKKRLVLILGIAFGMILVAALLSYYILPSTYQSSSQFIVIEQENENIQFSVSQIETNLELINTYKEIINSPFILEKVITELGLSTPLEDLQKDIEITSGNNSQVVTVAAIGSTPEDAALLANTVVKQFQSTIPDIMRVENVFVLSEANPVLSQNPISPRPLINIMIASIVGLATGIGLALFLELVNTKVKVERDIEELGIPVLGVVSIMNTHTQNRKKRNSRTKRKEEGSLDAQEG